MRWRTSSSRSRSTTCSQRSRSPPTASASGLEREVDDLQGRLEARKVVEQAKGWLQDNEELTESEAFRFIQKQAMEQRITMRQVAEQVLDRAEDQ